MPKLKRYGKGNWYIFYADGRRSKRLSTGTRDKEEAARVLARWEAIRAQGPETFDTDDLCDAYEEARESEVLAPDSIKFSLKPIRKHFGKLHPRLFNPALVRSYIAKRRNLGRANGTIDKELRALRQALSWGVKESWLERPPHIETPGGGPARDRWLSRAEAKALIDACVSDHIKMFIILGLHTGARCQAILDLTWDRADMERRLVIFPRSNPRSRKRTAIVPMSNTLFAALEEARELAETDWVIEFNRKPLASISKGFQRTVRRAGIKHCTIHDLRRTCASWMLQAGHSFAKVASYLGDTEEIIRRHYGQFSPDWLQDAAKSLD